MHMSNCKFFAEIESTKVALPGRFVGLCRFTDFFQQNECKMILSTRWGMDGNGVGTRTPEKR